MAMNAETRIGDLKVEVHKLPTMQAVMLSARLGRVIGPALGAAFQNVKLGKDKGLGDLDINPEAVARALFGGLDPQELAGMLRELLAATLINGNPANDVFDAVFADKLELLPALVKYVIAFQFGSFGRALLAAGGAVMAKAVPKESDSTSPTS